MFVTPANATRTRGPSDSLARTRRLDARVRGHDAAFLVLSTRFFPLTQRKTAIRDHTLSGIPVSFPRNSHTGCTPGYEIPMVRKAHVLERG